MSDTPILPILDWNRNRIVELEAEVRQLREENENLLIEYTQLCDMYEKDFDKKIDSAPRGAKEANDES